MTFDIMLPFWGRPDHFQLAVRSVLAQTHEDFRLVVVDDVYPDLEPGRWVQGLGDPRVEYHRNEQNLGVSKNYLRCVDLMRSRHSMLMGCDDIMLPRFIERTLELLAEAPDADVIQPGVQVIDGDGQPSQPMADRVKAFLAPRGSMPQSLRGEDMATTLARANWTYFPSLVWKVERIRAIGFRSDLDIVQDIAMLLDIAAAGGRLVVDDEVVFQYRRHASSVSSKTAVSGVRFDQERTVFDDAARTFARLGWRRARSAARWRATSRLNALTHLPLAMRAGDRRGVATLLRHAMR